jgi:hypothetical protein
MSARPSSRRTANWIRSETAKYRASIAKNGESRISPDSQAKIEEKALVLHLAQKLRDDITKATAEIERRSLSTKYSPKTMISRLSKLMEKNIKITEQAEEELNNIRSSALRRSTVRQMQTFKESMKGQKIPTIEEMNELFEETSVSSPRSSGRKSASSPRNSARSSGRKSVSSPRNSATKGAGSA